MKMDENQVEEEAFQLVAELLRRFPNQARHQCNFAQERAEFMTADDFFYLLAETPHYLERLGLIELESTDLFYAPKNYFHQGLIRAAGDPSFLNKKNDQRELSFTNSLDRSGTVIRGFYAVSFNLEAMRNWFERAIESKTGTVTGVIAKIPSGWKWLDEVKGIYQFGTAGRFKQGSGKIGQIFRVAMNLFEESPQAISIQSLSERTGIDKKVVRTRLHEINQKLKKLNLQFVSKGAGFYRIESLLSTETEPLSE